MLTQYEYIKPRYQFGKQCIFVKANVGVEDIYPQPELMNDYLIKVRCHREVSYTKQYALHEVQTDGQIFATTGMLHTEGGWPKDMNLKNPEAIQRFRRRVQKDENWPIIMTKLLTPVEGFVLQNNAVNIYENFFDDLIPTPMIKEYNIRVTNLYEDPEKKVRPVRHLSWSPNQADRFAVAYGFREFEEHPDDVSPHSYIWDIANPTKAFLKLQSSSALMTIEFNSRDPVLLLSGLASGQVCCWDIRASNEPVQISHLYVSHKDAAIQTLWIPSKSNTEFFSSSSDGTILWWDSRFIKKPRETLVMDLDDPERADPYNSVGVTALQYEPAMSSRFLAGTENGLIVNVNRRASTPMEKLAARYQCYTGPVVDIDRNPLYTKSFLTIGDWSAKVWADDIKEGCFLSTNEGDIYLSGGCWCKSRCSVFFVINREGLLEAYDLLDGMKKPLASIHVCSDSLTAIKAPEQGALLAVGSRNGNVYLLECSDDFSLFPKEDRIALTNYLERCGRYERAIENRLKEVRMMQSVEEQEMFIRPPRPRKKDGKDKRWDKDKKGDRDKKGDKEKKKDKSLDSRRSSDGPKRAPRPTRVKGKISAKLSLPELTDAEVTYFKTVDEEAEKYTELDPADYEAAQALLKPRTVVKPVEEESEQEKEDLKKRSTVRKIRSRARAPLKPARRIKEKVEEKAKDDTEEDSGKAKDSRARGKKMLKRVCPPEVVCEPEICCMDLEEKRKTRLMRKAMEELEDESDEDLEEDEGFVGRRKSFMVGSKWFRRLTDYVAQIPEPPRAVKRRILEAKDAPPDVLRQELELAKKEMRAWQESAIARTLSSWAITEKLEARASEKSVVTLQTIQEPEKSVTVLPLEEKKPEEKKKEVKAAPKKRMRGRKSKKEEEPTQEEIERMEQERQKELWRKLKEKVKRFDEQHGEPQIRYPRISAAFVRTSEEELVTDVNKNVTSEG